MRTRSISGRPIRWLPLLTLLFVPAACSGSTDQAAPSIHAFTGISRGGMAAPVVDPIRHIVYGPAVPTGIRALNERTGRSRILFRTSKRHQISFVVVDPSIHRLLAEDVRFVRLVGKGKQSVAVRTVLADVIDTASGRLIRSVSVGRIRESVYLTGEGNAAIDTSLHHGAVIDHAGAGVMVDLRNGRILSRFNAGVAASFDFIFPPIDSTVVDERFHRLFVLLRGPIVNGNKVTGDPHEVTVVSTVTGRVVRRLTGGWNAESMTLDPSNDLICLVPLTGSIRVLNARSLRIRHSASIGWFLNVIGVDVRAARLFLLGVPNGSFKRTQLFWVNLRTLRYGKGPKYGGQASFSFGQVAGAVDPYAGHVFVYAGARANIGVFNSASGRLLKRIQFGGHARGFAYFLGMVLDQGAQRLFLAGSKGVLSLNTGNEGG